MYFITTKRMLEVCFFQHTPTFIIEPFLQKKRPESIPMDPNAFFCCSVFTRLRDTAAFRSL